MDAKSIAKLYEERIRAGISKYIPGRNQYYHETEDYIFFIGSCTVYIKHGHRFLDLTEEVFTEMLRSYWREEKNNEKHDFNTIPEDSILGKDSKQTIYDITLDPKAITPEKATLIKERSRQLRDCVGRLSERRQDVITGIFFDHKTEKQLSEEMGSTQQAIHATKKSALEQLAREYEDELEDWEL